MRQTTILVLLLLVSLGEAAAEPFGTTRHGSRYLGMSTILAHVDDASAVLHNPGAMAALEGTHLYLGQTATFSELAFRMYDSEGALRPDREITPEAWFDLVPLVAGVTDFGTRRLRVGTAVHSRIHQSTLPADAPSRYNLTESFTAATRWTTGVAWRASEKFGVGLTGHLVHIHHENTHLVNSALGDDPDARFDDPSSPSSPSSGDRELSLTGDELTWSADLGFHFRPVESLRLGVTFATGTLVVLEGTARMRSASAYGESAQETRTTLPFALRGGVAWAFTDQFELAVDLGMWHWQVLQAQYTDFDDPQALGLGVETLYEPKVYHQAYRWSAGLRYQVLPTLELLVGTQHTLSPVPDRAFDFDDMRQDSLGISLGARWEVVDGLRVGLAGVRNWYDLIEIQESWLDPPTNAKGRAADVEVALDVQWTL